MRDVILVGHSFSGSVVSRASQKIPDRLKVFRDLFIQDARAEDVRPVWERLIPQPFQPWDVKLGLAEFYRAGLPGSYIAVADDRALPEGAWHPGMSSRLGKCKIVEMAGSHEVMFTRPAELARKLAEAAND